ncbi:MAG: sodium:solute symporter family protein [Planctomycetota bacterium]|jgi:Na+/proline symporter
MHLALADWLIIAGYMAFALGVGVWFSRRASKNADEYFLSGRSLPWWIAGTSMVATSFAADTPLFITGIVRDSGIWKNWWWWSFALTGMWAVFFTSRLWRRSGVTTDVEFAELRYGKWGAYLRGVNAVFMNFLGVCTMAWVILAMMKILNVVLSLEQFTGSAQTANLLAIGICIFIALSYSVLSGFWGVVVTDLVQFGIAMVGAVSLAWIAVSKAGGLDSLVSALTASGQGGKLAFVPGADGGFSWDAPLMVFGVFLTVQWWANKNADGGNIIIQRMNAARSESDAMKATLWFNIANYAVRTWPWVLTALASLVLMRNLPAGFSSEDAYPLMMVKYLPAGLLGVMVASLLAAFMSTIDSFVNLGAAYYVNDLHRRFLKKDAPERECVRVGRIVSILLVACAALVAVNAGSIRALWASMLKFSAGVGLVYIARWFWWRVNALSEILAMASSILITITLGFFYPGLPYAVSLLLVVAGSTVLWVGAAFFRAPQPDDETLENFYRRVRPGGWWKKFADRTGVKPVSLRGAAFAWASSSAMVLSLTLGIGKLLLGSPVQGALLLSLSVLSGILSWKEYVTTSPASGYGKASDLPGRKAA